MAKIIVLGAGVMGSAFAQLLADADNEVFLVGTHLDQDIIDSIQADRTHPRLKVKLPETVQANCYHELGSIMDDRVELVVFGVNSAGVDWAVAQIGASLKAPVPILMLTKGLAVRNQSIAVLPDMVAQGLSRCDLSGIPVAAVGGPCIAGELAARRESSVVIAHPDAGLLERLLNLVAAPYYHARGSADLIGVEVCAALKNFYTLRGGLCRRPIGAAGSSPERRPDAQFGGRLVYPGPGGDYLFCQIYRRACCQRARFGGRRRPVCHLSGRPQRPYGQAAGNRPAVPRSQIPTYAG